MANKIADKCGLKMKIRNERLRCHRRRADRPDQLRHRPVAGDHHDDRAKVVDFSVGYFKADQGLLVNKGTTVKTWDDVKKLTVGVQASTTAEYYVTSGEAPVGSSTTSSRSPTSPRPTRRSSAGTVDAVMIDTPINLGQAAQSGGKLEVVGQFKTGEEYGAIFGKGIGKKAIFDPIIQGLHRRRHDQRR